MLKKQVFYNIWQGLDNVIKLIIANRLFPLLVHPVLFRVKTSLKILVVFEVMTVFYSFFATKFKCYTIRPILLQSEIRKNLTGFFRECVQVSLNPV